jgi:hypothetical protein
MVCHYYPKTSVDRFLAGSLCIFIEINRRKSAAFECARDAPYHTALKLQFAPWDKQNAPSRQVAGTGRGVSGWITI